MSEKGKYLICNLGYKMRERGMKHIPELSYLTGIPQKKLQSFMNNNIDITDFELLNELASFFKCRPNNLVEQSKEFRTTWFSITPNLESIQGLVYFVKSYETGYVKIGRTNDLNNRLQSLEREFGSKMEVIHFISTHDTVTLEKTLHKVFSNKWVEREWFDLSDEDIESVKG